MTGHIVLHTIKYSLYLSGIFFYAKLTFQEFANLELRQLQENLQFHMQEYTSIGRCNTLSRKNQSHLGRITWPSFYNSAMKIFYPLKKNCVDFILIFNLSYEQLLVLISYIQYVLEYAVFNNLNLMILMSNCVILRRSNETVQFWSRILILLTQYCRRIFTQ